ncbi:hypothetical protein M407DRAFT_26851 [Tulasnella calospora MUT 4182]|uniref:C2H2-type domain-containing protein n=1 Tax=Tulasnella calospora MUT 4182 TaxID=1051891 RepID=A0A0C3QEZ7_9AGAM|nr:hypothetical protein M407DRAFT_26851 [Tulasnella calospora MUT 4182]
MPLCLACGKTLASSTGLRRHANSQATGTLANAGNGFEIQQDARGVDEVI